MIEALNVLVTTIQQCSRWFVRILGACNGTDVWLGALIIHCSFKFLFRPIFGYAGSDISKKSYNALKSKRIKDGD